MATVVKPKSIYCDVCGYCVSDDTALSVIGMTAGIDSKIEHPKVDRLQETFGKTEFHICFVCLLKSLGVKPKETNNGL